MSFKSPDRAVILAGLESSPGAGATSYVGIIADKGVEISADADRITREIVRPVFTPVAPRVGAKVFNLRFTAELKGAGTAGGDPESDVLLQMAGLKKTTGYIVSVSGVSGTFVVGETIKNVTANNTVGRVVSLSGDGTKLYVYDGQNAPSSGDSLQGLTSGATATAGSVVNGVAYNPISDKTQIPSGAVKFWLDGIEHLITYAFANVELDMTLSQVPKLNFEVSGVFNDPQDAAEPSVTFSDVVPPACLNINLWLGNVANQDDIAATALQLRLNNEITAIGDFKQPEGKKGFFIGNRNPEGSLEPSVTDLANFNPWQLWKEAGSQLIEATIGDTPGNRCTIVVPKAVYNEVGYTDKDKVLFYSLAFTCTGQADDELFLLFH